MAFIDDDGSLVQYEELTQRRHTRGKVLRLLMGIPDLAGVPERCAELMACIKIANTIVEWQLRMCYQESQQCERHDIVLLLLTDAQWGHCCLGNTGCPAVDRD